MSAEGLAFVDTNVLVYAYSDGQDLRANQARQFVDELVLQDRICTSTQVMQELIVTLGKKKGIAMEDALGLVRRLAVLPYFRIDVAAIEEAGRWSSEGRISFWDALILTSARRMGARVMYSEDLNHRQRFGDVEVMNPFLPRGV